MNNDTATVPAGEGQTNALATEVQSWWDRLTEDERAAIREAAWTEASDADNARGYSFGNLGISFPPISGGFGPGLPSVDSAFSDAVRQFLQNSGFLPPPLTTAPGGMIPDPSRPRALR